MRCSGGGRKAAVAEQPGLLEGEDGIGGVGDLANASDTAVGEPRPPKKKKLVGDLRSARRELRTKGHPDEVGLHDMMAVKGRRYLRRLRYRRQ